MWEAVARDADADRGGAQVDRELQGAGEIPSLLGPDVCIGIELAIIHMHGIIVFWAEMCNLFLTLLRLRILIVIDWNLFFGKTKIVIVTDYGKPFRKKIIVSQNDYNEKDLLESKINLKIVHWDIFISNW